MTLHYKFSLLRKDLAKGRRETEREREKHTSPPGPPSSLNWSIAEHTLHAYS